MNAPSYQKDLGLLILRIGIGAMFVLHGLPKLMGGPDGWEGLAQFGLPFLPEGMISIAFGFAAMATELAGGLLLALGKFHRIVCASLAGVMLVAFTSKISGVSGIGDFAKTAGWPLELLIVFVALFFIGPGRYALGKKS
jgi:putative oxidoreductase